MAPPLTLPAKAKANAEAMTQAFLLAAKLTST
jgi:hypothetical protein